jgi:hypothetical protein
VIIGILFHIGILYIYPIPLFAITVMTIYLLLLPETFWIKLSHLFKSKKKSYTFYYDAECPLCIKIVVFIRHFDFFNKIDCVTVQGNAKGESAFKGYTEKELLINIHGVSKTKKVFIGYDAYIELLKKMVYTFPIALLMMLPGLSFLGKKMYRYIAGNRMNQRCTGETCAIPVYSTSPFETHDYLIIGWNQLNVSKFLWKTMFSLFVIGQMLVFWTIPFVQKKTRAFPILNKAILNSYYNTKFIFKKHLGISNHAVFLNNHFDYNNHIFKITYLQNNKEVVIPIIRNNGMPGTYNTGQLWCYYTFVVAFDMIRHQINLNAFEKGLSPFLKFYAKENKIENGELLFKIYSKKIDIPEKWEKDFLRNQIKKPWQDVGLCKIENGQVNYFWNKKMDSVLNNIR